VERPDGLAGFLANDVGQGERPKRHAVTDHVDDGLALRLQRLRSP
jgi:hypothetical protein